MGSRGPQVVALVATATGAYVLAHLPDQPQPAHHRHHVHAVATADASTSPNALPTMAAITVYASKIDGETLLDRRVSLGPALDVQSVAYLAAVQAVTGPPDNVRVIRFPRGTVVREVHVEGATALVDLSKAVEASASGGFTESGEFKALVWTMTELPGVTHVRVTIDGHTVDTLPGGHLELDEPLTRSDF